MAKDIKERNVLKNVKTIDRAKLLSDKVRQAGARTKDEAESAARNRPNEDTPDRYAEKSAAQYVRSAEYVAASLLIKRKANERSRTKAISNTESSHKTESVAKGEIKTRERVRESADDAGARRQGSDIPVSQNTPGKAQNNMLKTSDIKTRSSSIARRSVSKTKTVRTRTEAKTVSARMKQSAVKRYQKQANAAAVKTAKRKAAARSPKAVKTALSKTIKAATAALRSLVTAIMAGSAAAIIALLLVFTIAVIAASPFGIVFSGKETPDVIAEINAEYDAKVRKIISENAHDELEVTGARAPWREVIAIYAVKANLSGDNSLADVTGFTDAQKSELKKVFWDMNTLAHKVVTKTVTYTTVTPSAIDQNDWEEGEEVTATVKVLEIKTLARSVSEMMDVYRFSDEQRAFIAEMLAPENSELLDAALYGISGTGSGSKQIVEVAASYIGNKGGEPFWRYMGFSSRVEWCACFVSYCANECGYIQSGIIPKYASVEKGGRYSYVPWLKERGLWRSPSDYTPNPGDLIIFDWGGDGMADHIGIVEKVEGDKVHTIEGNTSDMVARRSYALTSESIKGYGSPNY